MKRVIFLKTEYVDLTKKISKAKQQELLQGVFDDALKKFKKEMKEFISDKIIKIVKDYAPEPQVLIEFDDSKLEDVYKKLISVEVVEIIDSIIPAGD